jgi:hypothetical protein
MGPMIDASVLLPILISLNSLFSLTVPAHVFGPGRVARMRDCGKLCV